MTKLKLTEIFDSILKNELTQKEFISLPEIQYKHSISYKEARCIMQYALKRGWISAPKRGNKFNILNRSMELNALTDEKIEVIANEMNCDADKVVDFLKAEKEKNLSELMSDACLDHDEVKFALEILIKHGVVISLFDNYFININAESVKKLKESRDRIPLRRKFDFDF